MLRSLLFGVLAISATLVVTAGCQGGNEEDVDTACSELGLCGGNGGAAGATGAPSGEATGGTTSMGAGGTTPMGAGGTTPMGVGGTTPMGVGGTTDDPGGLTEAEACPDGTVNGEEAQALVTQGAFLLDVRTAEEYAAGHIDGATNIPVEELPSRTSELPTDTVIVTYCRSGNRSAAAAQTLRQAGLGVCDLGPMSAW
jgi:rhodanese-related sulfurtransferase